MNDSVSEGRIKTMAESISLALVTFPREALENISTLRPDSASQDWQKGLSNFASENRRRLEATWRFYFISTIVNYILLLALPVGAIIVSLIKGISLWSYFLGGASVATFWGTLIWKPQSKLLTTYTELNRVSTLTLSVEMLCDAINNMPDEKAKAKAATEALKSISQAIGKS